MVGFDPLKMLTTTTKSIPRSVTHLWDDSDFMKRLKIVMEREELFWSLGLVTRAELEAVMGMSEGNREYIMMREDQPFFTSINLKKDIAEQNHREKLEAALQAVLC